MRRLAIDFGTSNTVAALAVDNQAPRTITFGPSSLLPSAVYGGPDGITVGREAQRSARLEPSRFEPNPKRRIDDGDVLLGEQVFGVVELIAAVLRTVAVEVRRQLDGQAVDEVRLTHPAQWGSTRQNTLLTAARMAGLGNSIQLIPEPVAAAAQFTQLPGRGLAEGRSVAIYDLGGGTFDVAVVGRSGGDFVVLAEGGLADLGGLDFDQAILDLVGRSASAGDPARWQAIARPTDGGTRRAARALAEDIRAAKETLSDYSQTEVALPDPFEDVHLTRSEFEGLVRPNLMRSVEVLDQTLRNAGVAPGALSGIFLVGGSSRIPLVARLIQERFNIIPVALDQPETAVALGALAVPMLRRDLRTFVGPPPGSSPGSPLGPPPGSAPYGPPNPPGNPQPNPPPNQSYLPAAAGRPSPPTGPHPAGPGFVQPGYQQPGWAGSPPTKSRRKVLLTAVALVVALVVAVLIIAKPFASSGVAAPTVDTTTTPATTPATTPSTTPAQSTTSAAQSTGNSLTSSSTTRLSSLSSPTSTGAPVPTTLTADELAFVGNGFDVLQCIQPGAATGSGGSVTVKREAFCQLTTDLTGGTAYLIVITVASQADVGGILDELAASRVAGTADEDHAYTQNGVSGRAIGAGQLPIEGVDYPAVIWSQTGQNFVGVLAASGTITLAALETFWNDNVGT